MSRFILRIVDRPELQFEVLPLRFQFVARDAIHFSAGKSGNIVRGAFGVIFRRFACDPDCPGADRCEKRTTCPYARVFEPVASAAERGPSGLVNWPRPFVFRAAHLDGCTVHRGESFHFDVHLFDCKEPPLKHFLQAFAALAQEGLGPSRGRAELTAVHQLDANGMEADLTDQPVPVVINLSPDKQPVSKALVRFVTPTELKSNGSLAEHPRFSTLFARVRDRISTLRALYGAGPLPIDFSGMGERAAAVRTVRCELRQTDVVRRSSRTGQEHPLGGLIGEVEYEGNLAEFAPYLRAARWTGVGRQTVWGKGEIHLTVLD